MEKTNFNIIPRVLLVFLFVSARLQLEAARQSILTDIVRGYSYVLLINISTWGIRAGGSGIRILVGD